VKKKLLRIAEYLSAAPEFSGARVPLVKKKLFRIAEYLNSKQFLLH
jgi:predicted secreted protein